MPRRMIVRAVLALACLALAAVAARAQEFDPAAQGVLLVQPAQLVAASAGGCAPTDPCVVTYTLTLRATQAVTGIVPVPADLFNENDQGVFPAAAIAAGVGSGELSPTSVVPLTVTLDLGAAPAGSYSGKLWLTYDGGVADLPITARVRHWWLPAFLTLLGAVVGGLLFNQYRDLYRPRDELIIKADAVARRTQGDPDLAPAFRRQIERQIATARSALQLGRVDQAQASIDTAELIWHRWVVNREAWVDLSRGIASLRAALDSEPRLPVDSALYISLDQALEQSERDLALSDDPEATRATLKVVRSALSAYRTIRERIAALSALGLEAQPLGGEGAALPESPVLAELAAAEQELLALTVEGAADIQRIRARLDAGASTYAEALRAAEAGVLGTSMEGAGYPSDAPLIPLPELGVTDADAVTDDPEADARRARARRRIFGLASLVLTLVGLLPLGFSELYLNKPSFGANPWADYPALVFWGLGIEFTRQTILGLFGRSPGPPAG